MKKIFVFLFLFLISVSCFSFGRETLYDTRQESEFDAGNYNGVERVNANVQLDSIAGSETKDQNNPNGATVVGGVYTGVGIGNIFTTGVGISNISKIDIRLDRIGVSLGDIYVKIYLNSDKSTIGTSTLYAASYVSNSGANTYSFVFSPSLTLSASTAYNYQLYYPNGIAGLNSISVYASSLNPYAGGTYIQDDGAWTPLAGWDCYFVTYFASAVSFTSEGTYTSDVMDLGQIPATDKIFLTKQTTPGTSTIDWKYTGSNDNITWSDSAVTFSGGSIGKYRYWKFYGHLVLGATYDTPYFWFLEVDPSGAFEFEAGDPDWEVIEFGR